MTVSTRIPTLYQGLTAGVELATINSPWPVRCPERRKRCDVETVSPTVLHQGWVRMVDIQLSLNETEVHEINQAIIVLGRLYKSRLKVRTTSRKLKNTCISQVNREI